MTAELALCERAKPLCAFAKPLCAFANGVCKFADSICELTNGVCELTNGICELANSICKLTNGVCGQTQRVKILLATTSAHKAREIAELLADIPDLKLETLAEYPATEAPLEDGDSMQANARIKAEFYAQHFGTRVLADDSGLEVDALDGAPGVHSARWAPGSDADRVVALMAEMDGVPEEHRGARYRCALCLCDPCPVENCDVICETEGVCEGAIHLESRGEGGFGYDPIFEITLATGAESNWVGQTMAQVPSAVKASVSHRARAVRALAAQLKRQF